jgi:hypothetical protein
MMQIIGLIIFLGVMKRLNNKFNDPHKLLAVVIGAFVLRNFGFMGFLAHNEYSGMFYGFLNAAVVIGIFKYVALKLKEKQGKQSAKEDNSQAGKEWDVTDKGWELLNKKQPEIEKAAEVVSTPSNFDREISLKAVTDHLMRRGFKLENEVSDKFDLIAKDFQKKDFFIKIITFVKDDKNNKITLSGEIYNEALKLGRKFLLFIVTDTEAEEDAAYMGNYVKVYKLDSTIDDANFQKQGSNYTLSLGKFSNNASDWGARIR